jgi:peptidoglycan/LPS O-acetylase OafA/YrhL
MRELSALTGIRAVAALWVLCFHLRDDLELLIPEVYFPIHVLFSHGYLGVDLFFILSGFILAYNYTDLFQRFSWAGYRFFLWRRFARIYPAHFASIMILVIYVFTWGHGFTPHRYTPQGLVESLLMIHAWTIPIPKVWNSPSWSISLEWLAYMFFPLLLILFTWLRRLGGIIVTIIMLFATMGVIFNVLDYPGTQAYGLFRIIAEFSSGILICKLYRQEIGKNLPWDRIIAFLAILILFVGGITEVSFRISALYWVPLLMVLVIFGLAYSPPKLTKILGSPVALFMGRASYSLYLTHMITVPVLRHITYSYEAAQADFLVRLMLIVAWVVVILLVAIVMYLIVEEPVRYKLVARHTASARAKPVAESAR